ncbi:lipase family protein, putative [Ichthyophthirius multifiliis]|uniref:Lipase family protein, putative n=1 Tax=Ichthyophthirius multifiliis TaxID=5932 RepID=G0R0W7_ICHMU|nr:lipase family protein, putative [Ichthyophthirius multifiliis]EGR28878.1 lipase family protein, putative [Ichthyophthirius multifiliis]|eukprot:XP_004030114.1 lipase family protein, putative [Ichthyophthirius multifiliis]
MAFRGTKNVQNWINNIRINRKCYKHCTGCKVHKGFYVGLQSVLNQSIECITNLTQKYPTANVYIIGHSYGGALATLFAFELAFLNLVNNRGMIYHYTYGSPRVGNDIFNKISITLQKIAIELQIRMILYLMFLLLLQVCIDMQEQRLGFKR